MVRVLQSTAATPSSGLPDASGGLQGRRRRLTSGTLSPYPWDLSLWGQNGWITILALERRIGQRRDAPRAPQSSAGMATGGCALRSPGTSKRPPNVNLFEAKNGLDNGDHFISPQ